MIALVSAQCMSGLHYTAGEFCKQSSYRFCSLTSQPILGIVSLKFPQMVSLHVSALLFIVWKSLVLVHSLFVAPCLMPLLQESKE